MNYFECRKLAVYIEIQYLFNWTAEFWVEASACQQSSFDPSKQGCLLNSLKCWLVKGIIAHNAVFSALWSVHLANPFMEIFFHCHFQKPNWLSNYNLIELCWSCFTDHEYLICLKAAHTQSGTKEHVSPLLLRASLGRLIILHCFIQRKWQRRWLCTADLSVQGSLPNWSSLSISVSINT